MSILNKLKKIKKIRRFGSGLVILMMALNLSSPLLENVIVNRTLLAQQYAGTQYPILYDDLMQKANQVTSMPIETLNTEQSELVDIMNIESTAIWVDYICNHSVVTFPDSLKQQYIKALKQKIDQFNYYYSPNSSYVKGLHLSNKGVQELKGDKTQGTHIAQLYTLTLNGTSTQDLENLVNNQLAGLVGTIDSPVEGILSKIPSDKAGISNSSNPLVQEYYALTKFSYVDVLESTQTVDYIKGMIGDLNTDWEFKTTGMSDLLTKYSAVMALGKQELADSFGAYTDNNVSDSNIFFDQFTSNQKLQGSTAEVRLVNRAYWSCIAASATYIPLQSKVGNQTFQTALQYINHNKAVLNAYNKVYNHMKPLYFRSYKGMNSNGGMEFKGSAERVTLESLYNYLQNGSSGALFTFKNKFAPGATTNDAYQFITNENDALDVVEDGPTAGLVVTNAEKIVSNPNGNSKGQQNTSNQGNNTTSQGGAPKPTDVQGDVSKNNKNQGDTGDIKSKTPVEKKETPITDGSKNPNTGDNKQSPSQGNTPSKNNVVLLTEPNTTDKDNKNKDNNQTDNKNQDNKNQDNKNNTNQDNKGNPTGNKQTTNTNPGQTTQTGKTLPNGQTPNNNTVNKTNNTQQNNSTKSQPNTTGTGKATNADTPQTGGVSIPATAEISNPYDLTSPIFEFGFNTPSAKASMGAFLLSNILNSPSYANIKNPGSQFLFIDSFGDIVTQNGTVVIPAMANPTYYMDNIDYYIGTAAFLNSYPNIYHSSNGFQVETKNEINSFILASSNASGFIGHVMNYARGIEGMTAYQISGESSMDYTSQFSVMMPIQYQVQTNSGQLVDLMNFSKYDKGNRGIINTVENWLGTQDNVNLFTVNSSLLTNNQTSRIIPLSPNNQTAANFLADEAYKDIVVNNDGDVVTNNGRFNSALITDLFKSSLNGLTNLNGYIKNCEQGEQSEVQQAMNTVNGLVEELLNSELSFLGNTTGIIGVQTAFQNAFFGKVLYYVSKAMLFIFIGIFIFYLGRYARKFISVSTLVASTLLGFIYVFIAIDVLPVYLPEAYNIVADPLSSKMAYTAIMMQQDKFESPFSSKLQTNGDGIYMNGSPSITVFTLTPQDYKSVQKQTGLDTYQMFSGNNYIIDRNSGFYLQGTQLKYNVEALLDCYDILLNTKSTNSAGVVEPKLQMYKVTSNNIDYYAPLGPIMQGFITTLNNFGEAYNMAPKFLPYHNGKLEKSGYLVNSFTNSELFLEPQKFLSGQGQQMNPTYLILRKEFKYPGDWLNLRSILVPNSPYKNTLWYEQLEQQGYFLPKNQEKLDDLISDVNNETAKFIYSIEPQIPYLSDSTLVKAISLYATTDLDNQISTLGNNIYPRRVNYEGLSLKQVFTALMVDPTSKYVGYKDTLSTYILMQYGTLGVILSCIVLAMAFGLSFVIRWLIPIMYILFILVLLIRLIMNKAGNEAIKGYLKLGGAVWVSFFLFTLVTCILQSYTGNTILLFLAIIVYLIIFLILLMVIVSLLTNFIDYGNGRINSIMGGIADSLRNMVGLNKLTANSLEYANRLKEKGMQERGYRPKNDLDSGWYDEPVDTKVINYAIDSTDKEIRKEKRRRLLRRDKYRKKDLNDVYSEDSYDLDDNGYKWWEDDE